jgi:ABC-type sulfate/molybdate transport systems ATPase subunit
LKDNFFGVVGRRAPPLSSLEEARQIEKTLLVDPCFDRPERFFRFRSDGTCIGTNDAGRMTIRIMDLNAADLMVERSTAFEAVQYGISSDVRQLDLALKSETPHSGAAAIYAFQLSSALAARSGRQKPTYARTLHFLRRNRGYFASTIILSAVRDSDSKLQNSGGELQTIRDAGGFASGSVGVPAFVRRQQSERRLTQVSIRNIKGIESLDIELAPETADGVAPCLAILGENGTGKTSLLESIALALVGSDGAKKLGVSADSLMRRSAPDKWQLSEMLSGSIQLSFVGRDQTVELKLDSKSDQIIGSGSDASLVAYGSIRYFMPDRERSSGGKVGRVKHLFDTHSSLPDPMVWLKNLSPDTFSVVSRGLREILSLEESDGLVLDDQYGPCVRAQGRMIPINRLSDGYRSMVALAVDVIRRVMSDAKNLETAAGIVLIDELETHLHPRWKARIVASLRRSLPQVQFIITTHDPLCLRGMRKDEVVVLRKSFDSRIEKLSDLPDVTGMTAEQLLTSDFFGLYSTSEPSTELGIARLTDLMQSSDDDAEIERSASRLREIVSLGQSPEEQVAAEAMKVYLSSRRSATVKELTDARRRVINDLVIAFDGTKESDR